jgi:hypothetical protein
MASSSSSRSRHTKSTVPTSTSSKTRRSSAYDKDFEQHYNDHQVYPEGYDYRDRCPTPEPGLEGLDQRLPQPRPSLSPSRFPDSADFARVGYDAEKGFRRVCGREGRFGLVDGE